ncbi:MAG: hypothetical protein IJZ64_01630, partial [Ruminococcus sp.]|nr:hypothetical protein [Ruminococcus sp.]
MKKQTRRIGSLCLSAVMALSAIPAFSLGASAALKDSVTFSFETSDTREKTVNITKEQIAAGDVTFNVGLYLNADEQMTPDGDNFNYISGVQANWAASSNKYVKFSNTMNKANRPYGRDGKEFTTSTGVTFIAQHEPFCFAQLTKNDDGTNKMNTATVDTTNTVASDLVFGMAIKSAGPNKVTFTGSGFTSATYDPSTGKWTDTDMQKTVYELDVTVDENGDGHIEYDSCLSTYISNAERNAAAEKANGQAVVLKAPVVHTEVILYNYDPTVPSGKTLGGTNDIDVWGWKSVDSTRGSSWLGAPNEYPFTTFDVTVKQDTPDGVYYVQLNKNSNRNTYSVDDGFVHDANGNIAVDDKGHQVINSIKSIKPANYDDDESVNLKIVVGDGKEDTTTTTAETTTTTKSTTTTTNGTTTTATETTPKVTTTTQDVPKPEGYGWDIGKNFVEAGQANAKVLAPTVFNSVEVTGNVAALKPSAAAQALLDASTYKKYERNFDYEAILT